LIYQYFIFIFASHNILALSFPNSIRRFGNIFSDQIKRVNSQHLNNFNVYDLKKAKNPELITTPMTSINLSKNSLCMGNHTISITYQLNLVYLKILFEFFIT